MSSDYRRTRGQERRGFTLVELLVVIGIVGVLIALLLPAVQKVREAANRLACSNNLKNLSLALHGFHDTNNKFPPGYAEGPFPEARITMPVTHGWAPFILPCIEQQPLLDLYRWDLQVYDPLNQPVAAKQLPIFQCPSVPEPDRVMTFAVLSRDRPGACGDYAPAFYVDPVLVQRGWIRQPADNRGVLEINHMTRLSEITDGTANTILLVEDAGRPRQWRAGRSGPDQTIAGGPWCGVHTGITLRGASPDGATQPGLCAINCTNDHEVYSFHPGGANAVFADGSVHFLNASMSIRVLAALITRAGGEVVSGSDY
jgi:prepilin-type N-terminal cleavage/methylation domain-containing protein/prepilin-type processing-associated H-X9-DG protein